MYILYGSYQLYFSRNVEARTKGERRGERKECARDRGEKEEHEERLSREMSPEHDCFELKKHEEPEERFSREKSQKQDCFDLKAEQLLQPLQEDFV